MAKRKIIITNGSCNTVAWFRLELIKEFLDRFDEVYFLAPDINLDLKLRLNNLCANEREKFGTMHHIFCIICNIFFLKPRTCISDL